MVIRVATDQVSVGWLIIPVARSCLTWNPWEVIMKYLQTALWWNIILWWGNLSHSISCLASCPTESNFLMYDKNVNKCLKGYQPLKLFYCDSNQLSQQFRWTSNDRILNVHLKKCLGAGSTADGSGLEWLICDDTSQLQKWECKNDTLLNLKGTNLFLSQDENSILKLTQDIGAASQWLTHGTTEGLCSRPYQGMWLTVFWLYRGLNWMKVEQILSKSS